MENSQLTSAISKNDTSLRHLPSYEEANVPYTLRLPSYRSSYVRRYHPYARFVTPPPECDSPDDRDEEMLDLSLLDHRVRQLAVEREVPVHEPAPENNGDEQEGAVEDGGDDVVVDVEPGVAYDNGEEPVDPIFIRLDVTNTLQVLHAD